MNSKIQWDNANYIIRTAKALCEKFIGKVETGRARSVETYAECKGLLKMINENEIGNPTDDEEDCLARGERISGFHPPPGHPK